MLQNKKKWFSILTQILIINANAQISPDSIFNQASSLKGQEKINWLSNISLSQAQSNPDEAIQYAFKIIELSDTSLTNQALGYKNIGVIYYYQAKYNNASKYYDSALNKYKQANDYLGKAKVLNNMGLVFMEQGVYLKALDAQFEAYEINLKYGNEIDFSKNLTNIANIYMALGNHTKAMEYNQKAFDAVENSTNDQLKADVLNNLGTSAAQIGQHQEALQFYSRSLIIRQKINDLGGVATCYANIGNTCLRSGDYKKAEKFYQKAIAIFDTIHNIRGLVSSMNFCSQAFLYQKKYNQGEELTQKALLFTDEYNLIELKPEILKVLKVFLLLKGHINQASKIDAECRILEDSLANENLQVHMADLEATYRANEKEHQLQQIKLEREAQMKRWGWIVAGLSVVILSGILLFTFFRMRQRQRTILLLNQKTEIENRFLRSQMNPHFIFNSLNAIQSYVIQNQSCDADIYLSKFARLMRLVLQNSAETFVSFENEIESLELYLELEQKRFSNQFRFYIDIDSEIEPEILKVPPMLVQPYIENALIHGLMPLECNGEIYLNYHLHCEYLEVTICDNGIGRKASENKKANIKSGHKSMGLGITKQRIDMFNNGKNQKYKVDIIDLVDEKTKAIGTKVIIHMPWISSV